MFEFLEIIVKVPDGKPILVAGVLNRPQRAKMAEYLASIFGTEKDK